jgi:hypothetical protein
MEFLIVSSADIERCPIHSLSPHHYFRDDDGISCDCTRDPRRKAWDTGIDPVDSVLFRVREG